MADAGKTLAEQVEEIEKLLQDAKDTLTQAGWALGTLQERVKALEETAGKR